MEPVVQDKSREIRYTRNADFADDVAANYLERLASAGEIEEKLKRRDEGNYLRVRIG
jgi:hypothetical protein